MQTKVYKKVDFDLNLSLETLMRMPVIAPGKSEHRNDCYALLFSGIKCARNLLRRRGKSPESRQQTYQPATCARA